MLKLAFCAIILLACPFLLGLFCVRISGKRSLNPFTVSAIGYAVMFAIFQIIYGAFLIFDNNFSHMQTVSRIVLGLIGIVSLILSVKVFAWYRQSVLQSVADLKAKKLDLECVLYAAIVIFLIGFMLYKAVFFGYADDDDAYYLADAVRIQILGNSPMHINDPYTGFPTNFSDRHLWASYTALAAVLANTIGIHAAALAHFVFPPIIILIVNGIYTSIFKAFFRHSEHRTRAVLIALIIINLLTIFGNATIFTNTTFLLTRTWQGKSLLANMMVPLEFLILLLIGIDLIENTERKSAKGLFITLSLIMFGGLALSSMALILLPMMAGMGMLLICYIQKSARPMIPFALSLLPSIAFGVLYVLY